MLGTSMNSREIRIGFIVVVLVCVVLFTHSSQPLQNYTRRLQKYVLPPTVDIGFVCGGGDGKTLELLKRAIKSLFFYHTTPLHIHIIGDHPCYSAINVIAQQWNLSDVTVSFYSWDKYKPDVEWVPTTHYSGIYGILKLLAHEILPETVTKLILLDTDIVLNADIHELWGYFNKMSTTQLLGVVRELSPWYQVSTKWPARNRVGFNTGVLILDLQKMRERDWTMIWKSEMVHPLADFKTVTLGDQDIINVVAKERPELIYELPCTWNVQWRHDRHPCLSPEISDLLKILHINLPVKEVEEKLRTPEFVAIMEKVEKMGP